LRLVQLKEEYEQRSAALRAEIDSGLQQIKRGEVVDGPTAIKAIRERLNRQQKG
jgi:predicted transcriptional regulator